MNENKIFPEVGNDALNNDMASNQPVNPIEVPVIPVEEVPPVEVPTETVEPVVQEPVETVEPVMDIQIPTEEVPVEPAMPVLEETPVVEVTEPVVVPVNNVELASEQVTPVNNLSTEEISVESVSNEEVMAVEVPENNLFTEEVPVEPVTPVEEVEAVEVPTETVEPVAPESTEIPVVPVIETTNGGNEQVKPKKNTLTPIIMAVVAVALIVLGVWFIFFRGTNPVKLTATAFDKLKGNVNEITDVVGGEIPNALTQKGKVTVDFSSAYLASEDKEQYETIVEALKGIVLNYELGYDLEKENVYLDAELLEKAKSTFDLGIVVQNNRYYFHVLNKYVDVTDEINKELVGSGDTEQVEAILAELEGLDEWYFYDVIAKSISDAVTEDDFEESSATVTVDKKDVKAKKYSLRMTENNSARIINKIIENVNKDEKVNKIFKTLGADLSTLKLKKEDFEGMEPFEINFYSKGSDLVKFEVYQKIDRDSIAFSYVFGEKTDVLAVEMKIDGQKESASIELTTTKNQVKAALYLNKTKLATLDIKNEKGKFSAVAKVSAEGQTIEASVVMNETKKGSNFDTTLTANLVVNTVEYFNVVAHNVGTSEEKYAALDLKDAVKYEDLTDAENEEIEDYLESIGLLETNTYDDYYDEYYNDTAVQW